MIKDLKSGTFLNQVSFGLLSVQTKTTRLGKEYKDLILSDTSGQINAKVWSEFVPLCQLEQGRVVTIKGKVGEYQGNLEITLESAQIVNEDINSYQSKVRALVFDIETVGEDFDNLGDWEKDYLLEHLERNNQNKSDAKNKTGLYALFGFVCSIACFDTLNQEGTLFQLSDQKLKSPDGYNLKTFESEEDLLQAFWTLCDVHQIFVSFNGIEFDFPFLILRSAAKRIKVPSKMFSLDRSHHIDLAQRFKQGSRGFKLEALTRFLGLSNPKEKGVSGLHIANLYRSNKHQDIADYVARDVQSTNQLYELYLRYLS